jgi:hypothetical protein
MELNENAIFKISSVKWETIGILIYTRWNT